MSRRSRWSRRRLLQAGLLTPWTAVAQTVPATEPTAPELDSMLRDFAAGGPLREGRVTLDVAPLVDNGNTVPLAVRVDSPMTAEDHVVELAVFNERNPQREVLQCRLSPALGVAQVATRVRLTTSQKLVAVARMNDGACWTRTVSVVVTLAACVEG